MIPDSLVEASGDGHLDRHRQFEARVAAALEDGLDESCLQIVESLIEQSNRGGRCQVLVRVGLHGDLHLLASVISHHSDEQAQPLVENLTVNSATHFAEVRHEVGGALEFG